VLILQDAAVLHHIVHILLDTLYIDPPAPAAAVPHMVVPEGQETLSAEELPDFLVEAEVLGESV
jgi:hypothetical protein